MVDNIVLPGEFFYFAFIPLLIGAIPLVYGYIKRQELTGSKSAATEYNISSMRTDLSEVKSDVKELRKDQTSLSNSVRDIAIIQQTLQDLKKDHNDTQDKLEGAVRNIDNINWRLKSIEQKRNGAVGG